MKLSKPIPHTAQEKFEQFEKDIVRKRPDRVVALDRLRTITLGSTRIVFRLYGEKKPCKPTKATVMRHENEARAAEREFIRLLAPAERKRYYTDAKSWLNSGTNQKTKQSKRIDLAGARRWVAKRAYDFGWKKQIFQHDSGPRFEYKTDRALVERIGKKYQWLAVTELLCRLSDNYWIGGGGGDGTRKYDNPNDIGILRDIDPTVLQFAPGEDLYTTELGLNGPVIRLPQTAEDELLRWPFAVDLAKNFDRFVRRIDRNSEEWIVLYDHMSATEGYTPRKGQHGLRQQEFRVMLTVVVNRVDTLRFIEHLQTTRKIDVMRWDPPELTDGPFLRENPWRTTWPQEQWHADGWRGVENIPVAFPLSRYVWESPLDASLPSGTRAFIPSPWLLRKLHLSLDPLDFTICRDSSGEIGFKSSKEQSDGSWALIKEQLFRNWLDRQGLDCVWLLVTERSVWPGGDNDSAAWRRTEGLCWLQEGKPMTVTWNEDRVNRRNL